MLPAQVPLPGVPPPPGLGFWPHGDFAGGAGGLPEALLQMDEEVHGNDPSFNEVSTIAGRESA
mgnify:FL=1